MHRFITRFIVVMALVGLVACTTFHTTSPTLVSHDGMTLQKTYYHAETIASDGALIRMTVYQPALKKGETAPLLIHAHGYEMGRMARPFSTYGQLLIPGKASLRAWDEGYWVISYDLRGMGDSQGQVSLMAADKEPKDVSAVIDWALKNLPISQKNDHPLIGMIGESYGGAVQMSVTTQDPRIMAIVPMTTWYNLQEALFPQGVPKTDWLMFLGIVGYTLGPLHMNHHAAMSSFKEIFGKSNPKFLNELYQDSLAAHCQGTEGPHADALLIQGMRDVLFPLNQALNARACFQRYGRDVRLIAVEHGHLQLTAQLSPGLPVWYTQDRVRCDGQVYLVADIINDWLNGKLRDDQAALNRVPHYCVTGDQKIDANPPQLSWFPLQQVTSHSGVTGGLEWVAKPLEGAKNLFTSKCKPQPAPDSAPTGTLPSCVPTDWDKPSNGWLRPARIPIYAATVPTWIVGVPHVQLIIPQANNEKAVFFLRLAAWTPDSGSYRVLSQQVTPLRVNGRLDVDLNAVRDKLMPGEVLGLLVQGHSDQFHFSDSHMATSLSVAGKIGLPLAPANDAAPYDWQVTGQK